MSIANFLKITIKTIKKAYFLLLFNKAKYAYIGAGDGNRTHLSSLGSSHSTDELHLHYNDFTTNKIKTKVFLINLL